MSAMLSPGEELRERIEYANFLYADEPPKPVRAFCRSYELDFEPGNKWTKHWFALDSKLSSVLQYGISGRVFCTGSTNASAELLYYDPCKDTGGEALKLDRSRGTLIASVILEQFMLADLERPELTARNIHNGIQNCVDGLIELPLGTS